MEPNHEPISPLPPDEWPKRLTEIPQPPTKLWIRGDLPPAHAVWLTVVGSRRATEYGMHACNMLVASLRGYPVVIVSGLALGIDACAHRAALDAGLPCVAIPGSGLDASVLSPASNWQLAERIVKAGGCLLSPFAPTHPAAPYTFPTRNRIMVGISHAVLVIEATSKSGTLITARMAVDYNRELGVVPGSIFAPQSAGPHQFLSLGATPIYDGASLRSFLGFDEPDVPTHSQYESAATVWSAQEQEVLTILKTTTSMHTLTAQTTLSTDILARTLTALEIAGAITISGSTITRTT